MKPITTLAEAKNLLICRDINPVKVRGGWEIDGQVLSGKELIQLARQLDGGNEPSKYGNRRVEYDGRTFHSVAEMEHYKTLKLQEAAGEISDLECQPRYELLPWFRDRDGTAHQPIFYVADFGFTEQSRSVAVDVKGMETELFKLKSKLFRFHYPHIELRIVR